MKTQLLLSVVLSLSALSSGCSVGASAQIGFTQMAVTGDMALATGVGGVPATAEQDIESAFGLGDDQGSPYVRAQTDLGFFVLTGSGFLFEEEGQGTLNANFGGLAASTPVTSSLDFANAKVSLTFDFGLGPVTVSPGLAIDVFDVQFSARETTFGNAEEVDELLFVPLVFCRAEVELSPVTGILEVGFLETPEIDNAKARVLDVELMAALEITNNLSAFAGYRLIDLQGNGESGGDSFDIDMEIGGWVIGGMFRF